MGKKRSPATLCWQCRRSSLECPWLHEDKPVPGWEAVPTIIETHRLAKHRNSYCVRACPLYIAPPRRTETPKPSPKEARQARYRQAKEAGICTQCYHRAAEPGHTKCNTCLEKYRQWHRAGQEAKQQESSGKEKRSEDSGCL